MSLEFQRVLFSKVSLVFFSFSKIISLIHLFCHITNRLITCPLRNIEFCFPLDHPISVKCSLPTLEAEGELVRKRRNFGSEGPPCGSKYLLKLLLCSSINREFKNQRRDCSGDATKFAYLIEKNKSFARPSRAFFISVRFSRARQICDVK